MKVSFLTENLTNFLPILSKSIPTNSQLPILSNIYLEATSKGLILKATDMEKGVELLVPAKTEEEGSTTVPGREFIETISNLPKDKILIELKDKSLVLKCRSINVSFNTISSSEFPVLYKDKGEEVALFKGDDFRNIFSYLTFCVSQEDSRPQLTGVYIDKKEKSLNFVSTDGFRLSVMSVPTVKNSLEEGVIVDVDLINEVLMLKSDSDIVLRVNKNDSQILFEISSVTLVGRMISGGFPDYDRVIPKKSKTTAIFSRESMSQSVKLSSVFAKNDTNTVVVAVEGDKIRLTTATKGVGEGELVIDCKKDGEDSRAAFNVKYLQDLLKALTEDEVEMGLNSSSEPALFEIKGKSFKHVIMPIQTETS